MDAQITVSILIRKCLKTSTFQKRQTILQMISLLLASWRSQKDQLWKTAFLYIPYCLAKQVPPSFPTVEGFFIQGLSNSSPPVHLFLEFNEAWFLYLSNLLGYELSDSSNENQ